MRTHWICFTALSGWLLPYALYGADSNDVDPQVIVAKAADRFEEVFAQRDAKAPAKLFTTEAEYIDSDGIVFHGRDAIEAEY